MEKDDQIKIDDRFSNKVGVEYDLLPLALPFYDALQNEIASVIQKKFTNDPIVLVELGCGTGLTTIKLVDALPRARVTAVDVEAIMLEQAKKNKKLESVAFVLSDLLAYLKKLPDASVDAIASGYCIHNMPPEYRRAAFLEMGRVLKPGGVISNGDKIVPDDILKYWELFRDELSGLRAFRNTKHPELEGEWIEHYFIDDRLRFTELEQKDLMAVAGCGNVNFSNRWMTTTVCSGIKKSV